MNVETVQDASTLQHRAATALFRQWAVGSTAFNVGTHPAYACVPWRELGTFTRKLWEAAEEGRLGTEAARFHFSLITFIALKGLSRQRCSPVEPGEEINECLEDLISNLTTGWFRSLETTGPVGLVVHLVNEANYFLDLDKEGTLLEHDEQTKDHWMRVLACAVSADLIYRGVLAPTTARHA